ncbi:uncharacterized protein LOC144987004 [Oryzias latipes]
MSFTWTFQNPVLQFCLLGVLSLHRIHAPFVSPQWGFEPPEIDGSAVENNCRVFMDATPTPLTAEPATPAATRMQLMKTTSKPATRSPRQQEPKAPIRTQPAARGPISSSASLRLLHLLLAHSRGGGARSPQTGGVSSSSDESAAAWKVQTFPSKDSSEES